MKKKSAAEELKSQETLVQAFATTIVKNFISKLKALQRLRHTVTNGQLKEFFVSGILENFLPSQFGTATGIIVNQRGDQSRQVDIIIYDNRLVPAFISEQKVGVFPAESVIATIEVKSILGREALEKTEADAKHLIETIYSKEGSKYSDFRKYLPICAVFGGGVGGIAALEDKLNGKKFLQKNITYLRYIASVNRYSWIKMKSTGWTGHLKDNTNDETIRFIAVLIDNLRLKAELRYQALSSTHHDWLGIYLRHQNLFASTNLPKISGKEK